MKNLILITLFLVSWRTFKAEYVSTPRWAKDSCELKTEYHQETAENYFKARARQVELENKGGNYDVKIWELKEESK